MAWATLSGYGVIEARVEVPRVGAWVADLAVDTAEELAGAVTLDLNGYLLQGTVRRGGIVADTAIVRVVGGGGGLGREVDPLFYRGVPLQVPLSDALAAVGERLDVGSDPEALGLFLPFWARLRGTAGTAVAELVRRAPGAVWRTLSSGAVWVGSETWPESALGEYTLLREDPSNGRDQLYAETPALLPGTVFRGRRVSTVEHVVSAEQLRMVAWYE